MPRRSIPVALIPLFGALALGVTLGGRALSQTPQAGEDPIRQFRKQLADPKLFHFRQGKTLDPMVLQGAVEQFGMANAALLRERFEASLKALPKGEVPAAPRYTKVLELNPEMIAQTAASNRFYYQLYPEIEQLARYQLSMLLPLAMTHEAQMTTSDVGAWIGFFGMAQPQVLDCGRSEQEVTVCLDYGGQDVLVARLSSLTGAWVLQNGSWWQLAGQEEH